MRRDARHGWALAPIAVALGLALLWAQPAAARTVSRLPRSDYTVRAACAAPARGRAGCLAVQLVPQTAEARAHTHPIGVASAALATPSTPPSPAGGDFGVRPQDLHSAYQLPTSASPVQTIALVDAYNDPSAEADLASYSKEFGIPACTAASGCFKQVNQNGEAGNPPFPRTTSELEAARKGSKAEREDAAEAIGWAVEISLDIETARAVCQNCHIALVEANSPTYANLETAEDAAVALGANEVSNSWAGPECFESLCIGDNSAFDHPGVVIAAAAGDNGYLNWLERSRSPYADFPASSPQVVAVGGTRLKLGPAGEWSGETVWNDGGENEGVKDGHGAGGGGCSTQFAAQPWQQDVADWSAVGCGEKRAVADVSADSDPYTGVAVYDSGPGHECETVHEGSVVHWCTYGGTSVATPLIASTFAVAGGAGDVEYPARTLYENAVKSPGSLHDVTEGSNGECLSPFDEETGLPSCTSSEEGKTSCASRAICLARTGYDGPTGVGTPDGIAAFAPAPNAPTVATGAASSIAQTSATLEATVNPNGHEVSKCELEYGTSSAGESSVACSSLPGSGTSPVAVSAPITGLSADTTYHYRISATNSGGTSKGSEQTFKTLPNPPTVTTGAAFSITQTSATLEATVNPNGGEVKTCEFEYGPSSAGESSMACSSLPGSGTSPVAVSAPVTGLTADTTYHYRISATNTGGTSKGSEQTFKTLPNPPTVTTGAASSVTQTSATLGATINPNGHEVSECELEYGTSTSYESSAPCTPSPGSGSGPVAVTAAITGLTANTTYHFRIDATNAVGTSKGNDHTFSTLPNPPTVVTDFASSLSPTSATLGAEVNPNGSEVSECEIEYGTTLSYGSSVRCSTSPGSGGSLVAVSAPVTDLTAGTIYHFRISATNAGGTSKGGDRTFETLHSPSVQTGVATSISRMAATLHASVNPNGDQVSECMLEYGTTMSYGSSSPCSPAPGSGISLVAVSASVSELAANTTYHFRIVATNAGGTSEGNDETFTTLPDAPTVATGAASALTQTSATLGAIVNPNGGQVNECSLEYGTSTLYGSSAPCSPAPGFASTTVTVSASLTDLTAGTIYHFRIVAANAGGRSEGSDETFTTLLPTTLQQQIPGEQGTPANQGVAASQARRKPVPDAELVSTSLTANSSGTLIVKVSCPATESICAGTVTLRTLSAVIASATARQSKQAQAAILTIAAGSFKVAGGQVKAIKLHLSARGRALLVHAHMLRARATVSAHDPADTTHTGQTTVTIRAGKASGGHKA